MTRCYLVDVSHEEQEHLNRLEGRPIPRPLDDANREYLNRYRHDTRLALRVDIALQCGLVVMLGAPYIFVRR